MSSDGPTLNPWTTTPPRIAIDEDNSNGNASNICRQQEVAVQAMTESM
jgi:hypothetical protein